MLHARTKRLSLVMLIGLVVCSMALSACGLQPAVVDEPKPTATPVSANVPDVEGTADVPSEGKGEPTKQDPSNGAEDALQPGEFTNANGVPFPVPSSEANPIRNAPMDQAWGTNVRIDTFPTLIDAEHIFTLRGINEEGHFLVGDVITGTAPLASQSEQTQLAIMDTSTGAITPISDSVRYNDANYTNSSVGVSDDWVVWLSKSGVPGSNAIRAYNRASGKQITLDVSFPDYKDLPGALITGSPINANSVDHRIVVWAELSGEVVKGKVATVIKTYNLESGETKEIGKYGTKAAISWPNILWLEPRLSSEIEGEFSATVVVYNMETGETRRLNEYWSVREIALYGDVIMQEEGSKRFLENIDQTRRQIIAPDGGSQPMKLTLNDRLVAGTSTYDHYVWDRKLEEIIKLPGGIGNSRGYFDGNTVNGHMLAWQSGPSGFDLFHPDSQLRPEDVKIYVVDTNSLP